MSNNNDELSPMEKIQNIIEQELGVPYGDGYVVTDITVGYAEPGYTESYGEDVVVVFGNWNPKRFLREGDPPLTEEENVGPRLAEAIENAGGRCEWYDEWVTCHNCLRAVRSQPDSYTWKPSYLYWEDEDGFWCRNCAKEYAEEILQENYVNNTDNAVTWLEETDLEELGWARWNDTPYASGWYPGQDDDPRQIVNAILSQHPEAQVVFLLDENSQFYVKFSAWVKG